MKRPFVSYGNRQFSEKNTFFDEYARNCRASDAELATTGATIVRAPFEFALSLRV